MTDVNTPRMAAGDAKIEELEAAVAGEKAQTKTVAANVALKIRVQGRLRIIAQARLGDGGNWHAPLALLL